MNIAKLNQGSCQHQGRSKKDIEKVAMGGIEKDICHMVYREGIRGNCKVPNLVIWANINSLKQRQGAWKNHWVWTWAGKWVFVCGWLLANANTGLNLALFWSQTFEAEGLIAIPENETVSQGHSFGNADLQGNARRVGINKGEWKWWEVREVGRIRTTQCQNQGGNWGTCSASLWPEKFYQKSTLIVRIITARIKTLVFTVFSVPAMFQAFY